MDPMEYLPLTHGQKWWLGEMPGLKNPGWYNIEFLVRTLQAMDEAAIRKSVDYIVCKYESLRVRLIKKDGQWLQNVYPLSEADAFAAYDLSAYDPAARTEMIRRICIQERDGLLAERGNLVRILFFKFSGSEGRLWFCLHHLVSDFVSVLIVSGEFMAAYNSLVQGRTLKLQTMKEYRKWLYMVDGYCRDVLLPAELEYWLSLPWERAKVLPSDHPKKFYDDEIIISAIRDKTIVHTYREITQWMDKEATLQLYGRYGAGFEDVLIAVFFMAIADQKDVDWLDITVCNAGRNILPAEYGINVNNLLGWLSTTRALLLARPATGDLQSDIRHIVDQIRQVPNGGIGFIQISDHIGDAVLKETYFRQRQQAPIFFNYLGRVNTNFSNDLYETVQEDTGRGLHGWEIRNNLLACDIGITNNQLFMTISYSEEYFEAGTITAIMDGMGGMFRAVASGQQLMVKVA